MASIGSWWVANHAAEPGESVRTSFYANRLRRSARPHGGKLYVTDQRVVFCPHLIDALLDGESIAFDFDDIETVDGTTPADGTDDPYGGGRTRRLVLELHDEQRAYFVLDDVEKAVAVILEAITERASRA